MADKQRLCYNTADPCLYIRTDGLIFLVPYVDDMLTTGEDVVAIEDTKRMLMK